MDIDSASSGFAAFAERLDSLSRGELSLEESVATMSNLYKLRGALGEFDVQLRILDSIGKRRLFRKGEHISDCGPGAIEAFTALCQQLAEIQGFVQAPVDVICEHEFPEQQDFCIHNGHQTLGSHARCYVCRKCGALKRVSLGTKKVYIDPAAKAMQSIYYWDIIRSPHRCVAGWRGSVEVDVASDEPLPDGEWEKEAKAEEYDTVSPKGER
jgi:hypothetical protein